MLSEISQTQKAIYCLFRSYEILRIGKPLETEGQSLVASGLGMKEWTVTAFGFSFEVIKIFWILLMGM
jgi:hypothetical protein